MSIIGVGDFHKQVAERGGLPLAQVKNILTLAGEQMKQNIKDGNEMHFVGYFNVVIKEKKAKDGVNPFTGKKMKIAACKVPTVKLSASFKQLLKKK